MVKKLQKEGSLEPQIEDLINRIHELQQAKEKSSEELGEAQALWEALRQDLDSLSGEKVHLEEVLSRKQEALRTLQLHCQRKAEEAQRNYVLAEHTEQISIPNSQVTESQGQRKLGLPTEEQLEDLIGPHKDLWEFHMLKRRLAWEIRALQSSQEQLLTEERQALARLEDVERRLLAPPEAPAARAVIGGLKAEPEKLRGEAPAQTQNTLEDRAGAGKSRQPPAGFLTQSRKRNAQMAWKLKKQKLRIQDQVDSPSTSRDSERTAGKVGAACESMTLKTRMQVLTLGIKSHTDWRGRNDSGFQAHGYNTVQSLRQLCAFFAEHSSWL
ncbi:synaptonemal complex central element protein 1-like [Dama dama]|uniref:synaptonemal complex central element protein 1-like n=1 Tax=Dama dama TaxID=30532 RepID=UPI002A35C4E5|nr:synaptonemal complex central element protein 1-like [Dama dama]